MPIDPKPLETNGVDVAGALSEELLNRFAAAHYTHVQNIYSGSYVTDQFESRFEVRYKITKPLTFDLASLPPSRFEPIWISHMIAKGSRNAKVGIGPIPPTLTIKEDRLVFTFIVYKGHTGNVDFQLDLPVSLLATCAIQLLDDGSQGHSLRLEPVKIEFTQTPKAIRTALGAALQQALPKSSGEANQQNTSISRKDPSDPDFTTKLINLLLFLANQILATNMSNFIREWQLPRAWQLTDGVDVIPSYLDIANRVLIVGAQIRATSMTLDTLSGQVSGFLGQFGDLTRKEFDRISETEMREWTPEKSPSLRFLDDTVKALTQQIQAETSGPSTRAVAENIQLLANSKLFDVLAKRYLTYSAAKDDSTSIDHVLKAEAGWSVHVGGAAAKVVPGGIEVTAQASAGGYARVCTFNFDPKHFGSWACVGLGVTLSIEPSFQVQAYPVLEADGLYIRLKLLARGIGVSIDGLPGWANDLLKWITSFLSAPLFAALSLFVGLFKIRVVQTPAELPGTGWPWTPNLNATPSNAGSYLVFSGDPSFH